MWPYCYISHFAYVYSITGVTKEIVTHTLFARYFFVRVEIPLPRISSIMSASVSPSPLATSPFALPSAGAAGFLAPPVPLAPALGRLVGEEGAEAVSFSSESMTGLLSSEEPVSPF